MEKLRPYAKWIAGFLTMVLIPAAKWTSDRVIEGAEAKGYIKARSEIDEKYNQALYEAIIANALYDSCRESHRDSSGETH